MMMQSETENHDASTTVKAGDSTSIGAVPFEPFLLSFMNYDEARYEEFLQGKIESTKLLWRNSKNPTIRRSIEELRLFVIRSPTRFLRDRCRFGVHFVDPVTGCQLEKDLVVLGDRGSLTQEKIAVVDDVKMDDLEAEKYSPLLPCPSPLEVIDSGSGVGVAVVQIDGDKEHHQHQHKQHHQPELAETTSLPTKTSGKPTALGPIVYPPYILRHVMFAYGPSAVPVYTFPIASEMIFHAMPIFSAALSTTTATTTAKTTTAAATTTAGGAASGSSMSLSVIINSEDHQVQQISTNSSAFIVKADKDCISDDSLFTGSSDVRVAGRVDENTKADLTFGRETNEQQQHQQQQQQEGNNICEEEKEKQRARSEGLTMREKLLLCSNLRAVHYLSSLYGELVISLIYEDRQDLLTAPHSSPPPASDNQNNNNIINNNINNNSDNSNINNNISNNIYHNNSAGGASWYNAANRLQQYIFPILHPKMRGNLHKISIIGRSKGVKVVCGDEFISEELHVGSVEDLQRSGLEFIESISAHRTAATSAGVMDNFSPDQTVSHPVSAKIVQPNNRKPPLLRGLRTLRYKQMVDAFSNPNATVNEKVLNWICATVEKYKIPLFSFSNQSVFGAATTVTKGRAEGTSGKERWENLEKKREKEGEKEGEKKAIVGVVEGRGTEVGNLDGSIVGRAPTKEREERVRAEREEERERGGGDETGTERDSCSSSSDSGNISAKNAGIAEKKDTEDKEVRRRDLLELYCGNGNHTVALAGHFGQVLAVEIVDTLVCAARENFTINNIHNAAVLACPSEKFVLNTLKKLQTLGNGADKLANPITSASKTSAGCSIKSAGEKQEKKTKKFGISNFQSVENVSTEYDFCAVLVDPPRAGLDAKTRKFVAKSRDFQFDYMIYISCNPEALVRDLEELEEVYAVVEIAVFDQFAYTPHIESGVVLRRKS